MSIFTTMQVKRDFRNCNKAYEKYLKVVQGASKEEIKEKMEPLKAQRTIFYTTIGDRIKSSINEAEEARAVKAEEAEAEKAAKKAAEAAKKAEAKRNEASKETKEPVNPSNGKPVDVVHQEKKTKDVNGVHVESTTTIYKDKPVDTNKKFFETYNSFSREDFDKMIKDERDLIKSNFEEFKVPVDDSNLNLILNDLVSINKDITAYFFEETKFKFNETECKILNGGWDKLQDPKWYSETLNNEVKFTDATTAFIMEAIKKDSALLHMVNTGLAKVRYIKEFRKFFDYKSECEMEKPRFDNLVSKKQVKNRYEKSYNINPREAEVLYRLHGFWWALKGKRRDAGISDATLQKFRDMTQEYQDYLNKHPELAYNEEYANAYKNLKKQGCTDNYISMLMKSSTVHTDEKIKYEIISSYELPDALKVVLGNVPGEQTVMSKEVYANIFKKYGAISMEQAELFYDTFVASCNNDIVMASNLMNIMYIELATTHMRNEWLGNQPENKQPSIMTDSELNKLLCNKFKNELPAYIDKVVKLSPFFIKNGEETEEIKSRIKKSKNVLDVILSEFPDTVEMQIFKTALEYSFSALRERMVLDANINSTKEVLKEQTGVEPEITVTTKVEPEQQVVTPPFVKSVQQTQEASGLPPYINPENVITEEDEEVPTPVINLSNPVNIVTNGEEVVQAVVSSPDDTNVFEVPLKPEAKDADINFVIEEPKEEKPKAKPRTTSKRSTTKSKVKAKTATTSKDSTKQVMMDEIKK